MLPPMISRKIKHLVAFALALGVVMATIPHVVAASSNSTIYSFGTTDGDGAVPKGSLTYVNGMNGLLFGRTTMTTPSGGYGVIFHFDPNNVASSYSIDHTFAGHSDDGDNPRHDAMTPFNGLLYGTTLNGGTNDTGIIFSISQDGTGYQELFSLAKRCSWITKPFSESPGIPYERRDILRFWPTSARFLSSVMSLVGIPYVGVAYA